MNALRVHRHGRRCPVLRALAWPAWTILGVCGLALADPAPSADAPRPPTARAASGPDAEPPDKSLPDRSGNLDRPPDRTDKRPDRSDAAPPDAPPADRPPPDTAPPTAPAAAPAPPADRPASPPGPVEAADEFALDPDRRLEADFRSRRSLNHVLYRDRRYRLLLDQSAAAIAQGQASRGFDPFLELTGATEDAFVWDELTQRPGSARAAGELWLKQLPAADRARFERYIGAAAQGELELALQSGDFQKLHRVAQRYPGTDAALRAAKLIAAQLFDSGRTAEATAIWRLLADRHGATALSALERAQHDAAANETQPLTRQVDQSPHWMSPHGSNLGQRSSVGTAPYHRPVWSVRTSAPQLEATEPGANSLRQLLPAKHLQPLGDHGEFAWWQGRCENHEGPASALSAVVVNGCIIHRDRDGVVSRRMDTGARLWTYACDTWLDGSDRATHPDTPAFSDSSAENSLLLTLSTDGRRLYLIDAIQTAHSATRSSESAGATAEQPPLVNCLTAIELPEAAAATGEPPRVAWQAGGSAAAPAALAGHFCLGVPIPYGDRLLLLTECNGQVNLVILEAATGRVDLVQGLALVDRPLTAESDRLRLCFLPVVRDGLLVAPTPCGAVVAFDLGRRTLEWTAQYRALDTAVSNSWRGDGRPQAALHPVQPVFAGDQVLLLPPDAVELVALQVESGERSWSIPRRGGNQLAIAEGNRCLLVSTERVMCHDATTGDFLWDRNTGLLAGRGVILGDAYLAPRADGRLEIIEIATGGALSGGPEILALADGPSFAEIPLLEVQAAVSTDKRREATWPRCRPGNLVACGDWIVSASPLETAAYIQSARWLELASHAARQPLTQPAAHRRRSLDVVRDIARSWTREQRQLHLAELELTLGRGAAALPHLLALVGGQQRGTRPTDDDASLFPRAELMLRELLYWQLETGRESDSDAALAQLLRLAHSPIELARWHVATAQHAARRGDGRRWLSSAAEIVQLPPDWLIPTDVARSRQVAPAAILDSTRRQLLTRLSPQERDQFAAEQAAAWHAVAQSGDAARLEGFVRVFGPSEAADRARLQLARGLRHRGEKLAAEHWLRGISAESGTLLDRQRIRLLTGLERRRPAPGPLHSRILPVAALALEPPRRRVPEFRSPDSRLIPAAVQTAALAVELDLEWRHGSAPRVNISAQSLPLDGPVDLPDLSAVFDSRRDWPTDPAATLRILNLGDPKPSEAPAPKALPAADAVTGRPQIELALIRRDTAEVCGRIIVPARIREASPHLQPAADTFLPVADVDLHCLSLLDGRRLWTASVTAGHHAEPPRIGPSDAGYCVVQVAEGLACLDPVHGNIRWQRRDIAPDAGLQSNEASGLFGDAESIVLVAGDQRTCRVYSTATGELQRTVEIPASDTRRSRIVFGRRLFFATGGEDDPRFRLWDAAEDRLVLDVPARYPFQHYRVDRRHIAFVAASGCIVVFDALQGREVLQHPLRESDAASLRDVTVWRDAEQWFIHTEHAGFPSGGGRTDNLLSELSLPAINVQGLLSVYDAATGRLEWGRPFENRVFLHEPRRPVPFLTTLSRSRDALGTLTVEILDRRTGQVLAQLGELSAGRYCHASFDAARREYTLYGRLSNGEVQRIDIRYQLAAEDAMFAEN